MKVQYIIKTQKHEKMNEKLNYVKRIICEAYEWLEKCPII